MGPSRTQAPSPFCMTSDEMTSHCKILKDASAASPVFVEEVPLSCYVTKHALTSAAQQLVNLERLSLCSCPLERLSLCSCPLSECCYISGCLLPLNSSAFIIGRAREYDNRNLQGSSLHLHICISYSDSNAPGHSVAKVSQLDHC